MKNCYSVLPENYEKVFEIDAKNKKTAIFFNLISLLITVLVVIIAFLSKNIFDEAEIVTTKDLTVFAIKMLCFAVFLFVYIIVHELLHGVAYKVLTKAKLKFGISLSCAFCGVPEVFVNRKTALIALAAPLVVLGVILGVATAVFWFVDGLSYILSFVLLGLHLGGCCGDAYILILLLFKYKDKSLLINDNGPKQTIYGLKK